MKKKELNKNPNNTGYKILKYNEDTGICIIRDKYLNYGLSDKNFNIVLPVEYMNISFCKDGDTNENFSIKFENIKQKADFEKFLDETIEHAKDKEYSEFLIGEMTKIKDVVTQTTPKMNFGCPF